MATVRGSSDESAVTVVVALAANLGIAAAKLVAAAVSGSSAMLAEGFHALADSGNEVLLLVAQRKSAPPPDAEHPLGYGRAAYFWSLLAAVGVFVSGALLSVRQGIVELLHPGEATTSYGLAYAVLAVALVLESVSLLRAYRQLRQEAGELQREFSEFVSSNSDPIARAVFAEDAAAVVGNVVAAAGLALRQLTGSPVPDALAAIVIGLVLAYVAFQLARRNGEFLLGLSAPPVVQDAIRRILLEQPGIRRIEELLVTFLGPRQLRVLARVEVEAGLDARGVAAVVVGVERALCTGSPYVVRADVVPRSAGPRGASPRAAPADEVPAGGAGP